MKTAEVFVDFPTDKGVKEMLYCLLFAATI
jgi:hypothetical protein